MDPSYQKPIPCDKGSTSFFDFHLNFHVLGVLFLLSPLIYDICQIFIKTYHQLRAVSRRSDLDLAESTPHEASLSEPEEVQVVSEKGWGL